MSLRRVAAASVYPVSVSEAKAQSRVDGREEEGLISHYIAVANEKIGAMAGLVLGVETWELTVTDPQGAVVLPLVPIGALVSVNGNTDVSGYTLEVYGDCVSVSGEWPAGKVVIRFTAGGNVPPALKQAMLLLIGHWMEHRGTASEESVSEIPYGVESMVSDHRRGWIAA